MKNIVICFDGTWNTADAEFPTNVVKTAKMLLPTDANHANQVVFYDEGVGSGQVAFAQTINGLLGGAFGAGLMNNIQSAYRFLAFNYSPGDKIFLFGYSRGAFSARSFGGLLRTCGVLDKENINRVGEAVAIYKNRDRKLGADAPECIKFRRDYSVASYRSSDSAAPDTPHPLTIEYMGVWETVGSLGVPSDFLLASLFNRKYQFHDLALSRMVKSARHAAGHRRETAHVRRHAVGEHRRPQSPCRPGGCSCSRAALPAAVVSRRSCHGRRRRRRQRPVGGVPGLGG